MSARATKTVGEYVPIVMSSLAESTQRGWATYARLVVETWGDRALDDVDSTDIEALARRVRADAQVRAVNAMGTGAEEGLISLCRAVWRRAVENGYATRNPAASVRKPTRREAQHRRALNREELGAVQSVLMRSPDPELALLIFRICLETGARRNELLGLKVRSLATSAYGPTLTLADGAKMSSRRSLPISTNLEEALHRVAAQRLGEGWEKKPEQPLLRTRRGQPVSRRYLENLAKRVREFNPAIGSQAEVFFTWHVLRHTAGTLVDQAGGFAAASFFLGHSTKNNGAAQTTLGYTKPSTERLRAIHTQIWDPPAKRSPAGQADWSVPF